MKGLLLSLCLFSIFLGNCGRPVDSKDDDSSNVSPSFIISDRSGRSVGSLIYLYRLENPALFASAKRDEEGNLTIDSEAQGRIQEEQEVFIEKLKKISSDIKVIYTYQFVVNGVSIATPVKYLDDIAKIQGITESKQQTIFRRPQTLTLLNEGPAQADEGLEETTTKYLGIDRVWEEQGITGKGIKIGIIDTGVDYTHAMLGGPGTLEAYKSVNGDTDSEYFPNDKVKGGIDLVGSRYHPASSIYNIPSPDNNPMDATGHGTHVAATSAGIGDGVNTFSGAAPGSEIYAIKVFSKARGTGDSVIIAGLEYAADPNRDGDPRDHLDILNLSLGQSAGTGKTLYSEAIRNLFKVGIVVVVAAGNDGNIPYSVGSPSTVDEAISVGSSIDAMPHNWRFPGVEFKLPEKEDLLVVRAEAEFSKPISAGDNVSGKLVYAGLADVDFDADLKEKVNGNIVLLDRGKVAFIDKFKRAQKAGAIGVVVANNEPGDLIYMGGSGRVDIPGISVTLAIGNTLKESLSKDEEVVVDFGTDKTFDQKELINTISGFSSRGPRSLDGLIKPEIVAPGSGIISAKAGSGTDKLIMSGTSMAAPLVAGIFALLKEKFTDISGKEMKALLMNRGKFLTDPDGNVYSVVRQGAGIVQANDAIGANFLAWPGSFSLGHQNLIRKKSIRKKLLLRNLGKRTQLLKIQGETSSPQFTIEKVPTVFLRAGESKEVDIIFTLKQEDASKQTSGKTEDYIAEFEGVLKIADPSTNEETQVPIYLFGRILSNIETDPLLLHASYMEESEEALTQLTLTNKGIHSGVALPFNLLGSDPRKFSDPLVYNTIYTRDCDLESAGYRFVRKEGKTLFQIGVKFHVPLLYWDNCEISVQIDTDGDKIPDQEFVGIFSENLSGLEKIVAPGYYSLLLNSDSIRKERRRAQYNAQLGVFGKPDYSKSVVDINKMIVYQHSTVAIIQTSLENLEFNVDGELSIKLGTLNYSSYAIESDDFLSTTNDEKDDYWFTINGNQKEHGFYDFPEKIELRGGERKTVNFTKGAESDGAFIVYMPMNRPKGAESTRRDDQSSVPKVKMKY